MTKVTIRIEGDEDGRQTARIRELMNQRHLEKVTELVRDAARKTTEIKAQEQGRQARPGEIKAAGDAAVREAFGGTNREAIRSFTGRKGQGRPPGGALTTQMIREAAAHRRWELRRSPTQGEVAEYLGRSRSTVEKVWRRTNEDWPPN